MKYTFKNIPPGVILKYSLLQVPALGLVLYLISILDAKFQLPQLLTAGTVIVWILKDIFVLPVVWRSYDSRGDSAMNKMNGRRGIVHQCLDPEGLIKIGAELWRGEVKTDAAGIEAGQSVTVIGNKGLKLVVVPHEENEGVEALPRLHSLHSK